jgi:hypothetical protein
MMAGGLKARRKYPTDVAVVIDDKNISQASPQSAVQFAF